MEKLIKLICCDKKTVKVIGLGFISLGFLYYLCASLFANLNFSTHRYFLYMDELISFDGVQQILDARSLKELFDALVFGASEVYGRSFFFVCTIASWIPRNIWGEQGQVVATRMIQTTMLFTATGIISFSFIKSYLLRALNILLLLALPSTVYFSTMPKPEPLQLLLMTLFIVHARKVNFKFGWAWLFLGMVCGTKFSGFIWLTYFGFITLLFNFREYLKDRLNTIKSMIKGVLWLLLGLIVSEPSLLAGPKHIKIWFQMALLNSTHGQDDSRIGFLDWIHYTSTEFFAAPIMIESILLLFLAGLLFLIGRQLFKDIKLPSDDLQCDRGILLGLGLFYLVFIFCRVDRLWGVYLHPIFFFIFTGAVSSTEQIYLLGKNQKKNHLSLFAVIFFLLLSVSLIWSVPKSTQEFVNLGKRKPDALKVEEYNYLSGLIDFAADAFPNKLRVWYEPHLYAPNPKDLEGRIFMRTFYGSFNRWPLGWEIIILYDYHLTSPLPEKTSVNYEMAVVSKMLNARHIMTESNQLCLSENPSTCYVPISIPLKNVVLFARYDFAPHMKNIVEKYQHHKDILS